jgi:hypothetical protein
MFVKRYAHEWLGKRWNGNPCNQFFNLGMGTSKMLELAWDFEALTFNLTLNFI